MGLGGGPFRRREAGWVRHRAKLPLNSHRLLRGLALFPVTCEPAQGIISPINACFTYTSCSNYSSVINKGNNTSGANCGSKQMYKTQRRAEACVLFHICADHLRCSGREPGSEAPAGRQGRLPGRGRGEVTHSWRVQGQRSSLVSQGPLL